MIHDMTKAKRHPIEDMRAEHAHRMRGYRERALRIYPHVCARCGRAFEGKRLKELTVHHKDHNHDHNPADGSNWELLCLYCHDFEHEKFKLAGHYQATAEDMSLAPSIFRPFEHLDALRGFDNDPAAGSDQ